MIGQLKSGGGASKLASFQSNQPAQQLDVPSYLDKIKVKSQPLLAPGVRYVTEQYQYDLTGTENLQVIFKKQYALGVGVSLTGGTFGGSDYVLKKVKFSPASEDGYYDAGTTVTVNAPNGGDILFGHWVIKDGSNGNVNSDIREFSSADNPLKLTLNHPTYLFGRFVGEWKKLRSEKALDGKISDGIVVKNLVDGQKVKILQNGKSILEKMVEIGGTEVTLAVGSEKQLRGVQIIITAPDGETVMFESPIYEKIQAGDQFFY